VHDSLSCILRQQPCLSRLPSLQTKYFHVPQIHFIGDKDTLFLSLHCLFGNMSPLSLSKDSHLFKMTTL
jgi:hypothetical protein